MVETYILVHTISSFTYPAEEQPRNDGLAVDHAFIAVADLKKPIEGAGRFTCSNDIVTASASDIFHFTFHFHGGSSSINKAIMDPEFKFLACPESLILNSSQTFLGAGWLVCKDSEQETTDEDFFHAPAHGKDYSRIKHAGVSVENEEYKLQLTPNE